LNSSVLVVNITYDSSDVCCNSAVLNKIDKGNTELKKNENYRIFHHNNIGYTKYVTVHQMCI